MQRSVSRAEYRTNATSLTAYMSLRNAHHSRRHYRLLFCVRYPDSGVLRVILIGLWVMVDSKDDYYYIRKHYCIITNSILHYYGAKQKPVITHVFCHQPILNPLYQCLWRSPALGSNIRISVMNADLNRGFYRPTRRTVTSVKHCRRSVALHRHRRTDRRMCDSL